MASLLACKAMAVSSSRSSPSCCVFSSTTATATRSHGGALSGQSMACLSLKNAAGTAVAARDSLLLLSSDLHGTPLRSGDEHRRSWSKERPSGVALHLVQACIGSVKEVKQVSHEPLYYNVTLTVSPQSDVAKSYTTPGQYVNLIPAQSQHSTSSAFFIASPPRVIKNELEFLILDVASTVANELINSKPGERVSICSVAGSKGFDVGELNDLPEAQSVLMFASSYGMGPLRALIEQGFDANKRRQAILYAMDTDAQMPYASRFPEWQKTGVTIKPGPLNVNDIVSFNPANTVVLMVATDKQQEMVADHFERNGLSPDRIQTLFGGIPTSETSFYNKVLYKLPQYPKFQHLPKKYAPVELRV